MVTLDQRQIKEIAEQLDCGFRAFWHKTTGKLVFIIDRLKFPAADLEEEDEQIQAEIDANREDYLEIEAMRSSDSYRIMVDFAQQLTNAKLQDKLLRALDKRGPFREFNFVVDNSGDTRQYWFEFKNQRYIDWVTHQINRY